MKQKKIPIRKCVVCNENKPKKELLRIVNNKEQGIVLDLTGKVNGRGAYVCNNSKCIELAAKNRKLEKALITSIDESLYKEIMDYVENSAH